MLEALLAALLVSLASLVGALLLRAEERLLLVLVSFAAGTFLGAYFLHVLPRVSQIGMTAYWLMLASFIFFALLEKLFHFHSHDTHRSVGVINLLGDLVHNFIDGLGIASAFKVDTSFGWLFTLIVLAHELPQELGDYAVLRVSGFSKGQALLLNFFTALTAILGVVVGWFLQLNPLLLVSFVGASFLYIGASDLVPLLKEKVPKERFLPALLAFLTGIALMALLRR